MKKEYKCAMCGSVSEEVPGVCCGGERQEMPSHMAGTNEHTHEEEHHHGDGHDHAGACLACQAGKGEHTCHA